MAGKTRRERALERRAELLKKRSKTEIKLDPVLREICREHGCEPIFQYPVYPEGVERYWILDWFIPERKLVFEVDGPHHAKQEGDDAGRDEWLLNNGCRILRLPSRAIWNDLKKVKSKIRRHLLDHDGVKESVRSEERELLTLLRWEDEPAVIDLIYVNAAFRMGVEERELRLRVESLLDGVDDTPLVPSGQLSKQWTDLLGALVDFPELARGVAIDCTNMPRGVRRAVDILEAAHHGIEVPFEKDVVTLPFGWARQDPESREYMLPNDEGRWYLVIVEKLKLPPDDPVRCIIRKRFFSCKYRKIETARRVVQNCVRMLTQEFEG